MISKTAPLPIAEVTRTNLPDRLSLRTCLLLILSISVALWIAVALVAGNLFG